MPFRIALPCALLLCLAGCASQTMPDGSTRLSLSPANLFSQPSGTYGQPAAVQAASAGGTRPFDAVLIHRVAMRFVADWRRDGINTLSADIKQCYADADLGRIGRTALRDCLALDTVGKNCAFDIQQKFRAPGLPYFSADAELARFNRYAPRAFGTPAEALDFIGHEGRAAYLSGAMMLSNG